MDDHTPMPSGMNLGTSQMDINDKMLNQALKAEAQSRDIYPSLNYFRTDDLQSNFFHY
jgi:hypothetical protein